MPRRQVNHENNPRRENREHCAPRGGRWAGRSEEAGKVASVSSKPVPLWPGSIRAARVLADAASAVKTDKAAFLRFTLFAQASVRREARRTAPGAGALPNSARRCLQKAAGDGRTPRRFASARLRDLCVSFWTAPALWRYP